MDTCKACGHRVDVGRFCLNCGTPIDGEPHPELIPDPTSHLPPDRPRAASPHRQEVEGRPLIAWLPVLVIGLVLLAGAAGVGAWLLGGASGDDSEPTAAELAAAPGGAPSASEPAEPRTQGPEEKRAEPQDLIRFAIPEVPGTAPPGRDTSRNLVRYDATNMVDGLPGTTWRTPGDATGGEITLTFPARAVLTRVGLINGYAKRAGSLDWYDGNRRIESVTWTFDDGTTVRQDFAEDRTLQSIDIDPVTTTTITMTIDAVTAPGSGPASRDYTAISDVLLFGTAA